ncbi:MAG: HPP family protein [Rhodocyclaceae bacterium]|nr:MAG: HPP family protein [Rhodocyclaceae bacterium]
MTPRFHSLKHFLGIPATSHHGNEQLVATLGGIISIVLVLLVTAAAVGPQDALLIVPSIGASAVLIFAVPHSPFAQPWSVLAGHLSSAIVGVACYQWIPQPILAAGCAVGLAIGVMHLTRSIHPPGGATALAAVIGGPALHKLGYGYVVHPIAINCAVILLAGIAFNCGFPWRRYPASLMRYKPHTGSAQRWPTVSGEHLSAAMDSLNVVIDVNPEELQEIVQHALELAQQELDAALPTVTMGRYYSNNKPGQQWSVRQIVDERRSDNPEADLVVYKVVEGSGLNRTGSCTRTEFARWVGRELQPTKTKI